MIIDRGGGRLVRVDVFVYMGKVGHLWQVSWLTSCYHDQYRESDLGGHLMRVDVIRKAGRKGGGVTYCQFCG